VRIPGITRFHGAPFIKNKSSGFTDPAQSLIKISLFAGVGVGTSANWSTSGDPYCARTIAFMECRSRLIPIRFLSKSAQEKM
jgi:hypothetical protein